MIPHRLARELTYQLEKAGEHERLAWALASVPVFLVLYVGDGESNVLALWQQLAAKGHEPEQYYRASLDALRKMTSGLLPEALPASAGLFKTRGEYDLSVELFTELFAWAERQEDEKRAMEAHDGLGVIFTYRGDYDQAMMHLTESLLIAESLDDKRGMSHGVLNMGNVHKRQGRYAEAMACYERSSAMAESLGDKSGMSMAVANMGTVHSDQGRYAEAMACFERSSALAESLGDKSGVARVVGIMGNVHADQGRYAEAMSCFERDLAISESVGDKHGLAIGIGNMGGVHLELGRHEEALGAFRDALARSRGIGDPYPQTYWLAGIAQTLLELAEGADAGVRSESLRKAREHAEQCVHICEELSNPNTLFLGWVLLARVHAAEGNAALGLEKLEGMLAEATDDEQIAELHYWLWKLTSPSPGLSPRGVEEHRVEALTRYTALYMKTPKFEFKKRIAELKGKPKPEPES